jgi:hypothetical protein
VRCISAFSCGAKGNIICSFFYAFYNPYARYSVLPAISHDGMIAAKVVEGSFNPSLFTEFIEGLLARMQPFPAKNLVIVMENCRIHKDPVIIEMIQG